MDMFGMDRLLGIREERDYTHSNRKRGAKKFKANKLKRKTAKKSKRINRK